MYSQRKTREMKAAAGGKGGRTGSKERMFPALLLTQTVADVEEMIETYGLEWVKHRESVHKSLQTKKQNEARG